MEGEGLRVKSAELDVIKSVKKFSGRRLVKLMPAAA